MTQSNQLPGLDLGPSTATARVRLSTVVETLSKERILDLAREQGLELNARETRAQLAKAMDRSHLVSLAEVLSRMLRDELRKALDAHDLDSSGRSRAELADRLLEHSAEEAAAPADEAVSPHAPYPGRLALVRQRQYLVTDIYPPPPSDHLTAARPIERVKLVCLDDDAQGREVEVFWPLELGARVIEPHTEGLGQVRSLDDPATFGAYLNTLRWNSISATDSRLFQSPFRAGIQLMDHQIPPLAKALDLPRANLFIADDVGLGKTIEAGLVLQELMLRQQVERVLIVAPASVGLQWRTEMEQRFGQRFEIMNRAFVARRRRERGFGVNPWSTHSRFIVSYSTLRRPEYLEPLLSQLTDRARRSLLILDEAHKVAPSTSSRYAVDSGVTKTIRELARRFDNRLFLSATPHNGHSNSFSALLEILDPARFTRGVPIEDPDELTPVMIRRLKSDLKALGKPYPDRRIVRVEITHEGNDDSDTVSGTWRAAWDRPDKSPHTTPLGSGHRAELTLAELLAEYTKVAKPLRKRGQLVFVSLQKRLLSSIEAFHRTLNAHAKWLDDNPVAEDAQLTLDEQTDVEVEADADTYGESDDQLDAEDAANVEERSRDFERPSKRALELLTKMRTLTSRYRHMPSPKVLALRQWLAQHCCPALAPTADSSDAERPNARKWTERRVIIFTEYGDTKRYLRNQLRTAMEGTHLAEQRLLELHGGMGDDKRAEVQSLFNDPKSPARVLLATDAAREGVNLHGACADLFHYDVPWNPARLEQRNGRIDRTGQREPEVRCHYFTYPQRPEDRVLEVLVGKVETIRRELGSLGTIVLDQIEATLKDGIREDSAASIDSADRDLNAKVDRTGTAQRELESSRAIEHLKKDLDKASRALQKSRERVGVEPAALKAAIDVGCRLAGGSPLVPTQVQVDESRTIEAFTVPHEQLAGWDRTLDSLRPARLRKQEFWEWRNQAPLPVVFEPLQHMGDPVVHLHLEHPFVKRALSRFRAQGYGQSDLSRASIVRVSKLHEPRVVAFARLSLFGEGARRLHDELIAVAAPWRESGGVGELLSEADTRDTLRELDAALLAAATDPKRFPEHQAARLAPHATENYATLWPALDAETDAKAKDAEVALETRGRKDAEALRRILESQKTAIDKRIKQLQLDLGDHDYDRLELQQVKRDQAHMVTRREALDTEIDEEPKAIERLYQVELTRVMPVGLVYLWPETRA